MAKLQLALDFSKLDDALKVAEQAGKYCDIIEAGTPLIKSEGLRSVQELRRMFPGKIIVADMKTMDTGAFEAGLAADAGADITTVCGAADMATVKGAIDEGRKRGIQVAVDLINVPPSKWKALDALNPDYLCIHAGIDQQGEGKNPLTLLKKLKAKSKVMAAGGINAKTAPVAVKEGAEVVIVGAAITKARDPEQAAKEIKAAIS